MTALTDEITTAERGFRFPPHIRRLFEEAPNHA